MSRDTEVKQVRGAPSPPKKKPNQTKQKTVKQKQIRGNVQCRHFDPQIICQHFFLQHLSTTPLVLGVKQKRITNNSADIRDIKWSFSFRPEWRKRNKTFSVAHKRQGLVSLSWSTLKAFLMHVLILPNPHYQNSTKKTRKTKQNKTKANKKTKTKQKTNK